MRVDDGYHNRDDACGMLRALAVLGWLCVTGCGRLGLDRIPTSTTDVHSLWLHVDRTDVLESLIDFPLMVSLDDKYVDRSLLRSDARDLQFLLDGQPLAYEIEDPGTPGGDPLIVWLRVPQLSGRATTIRMDYGGGQPSPAGTEPVWSDSYAFVLHFAEPSSIPHDATGHYPAGKIQTATVEGPTPARGKIGPGREFQGDRSDAIQVNARELKYSPITLSGWLYETKPPPHVFHAMVSREYLDQGDNVFWLGNNSDHYRGEMVRASGTQLIGDTPPLLPAVIGRWTHLVLTASTSDARLYIDGQLTAQATIDGLPPEGQEKPINVGADVNHADGKFDDDLLDGILDEVRVETVVRSAEWIRIDHLSMTDQLIRFEPVVDPATP